MLCGTYDCKENTAETKKSSLPTQQSRKSTASLPTYKPIQDKVFYAFSPMPVSYMGYKIRNITE